MDNQETRFVEEIIERFHSGRFSRKVWKKFHLWLLSPKDYTAKDEAMNKLWLSLPNSVTRSVYRSLDAVKSRLGMSRLLRREPVRAGGIAARVAAVLLPAAVIVGAYFMVSGGVGKVEWASVDVPRGTTGYQELADGTKIWLNAGSRLEYPVKFKGRKRDVKLYGEGFFDVAPNKRKPFAVQTRHMTTEVVGTEFNISCYGNQKNENVTVLSGSVDVTTSDSKTHNLVPDRHLTHRIEDGHTEIQEVDAASMIRWMDDGLVFENSTLEDILCALQRKYDFKVVADPAVMTGALYRMKFVNGEPLEYMLDVVHSVAGHPYRFENGVLEVGGSLKSTQEQAMKNRLQQSGGNQ